MSDDGYRISLARGIDPPVMLAPSRPTHVFQAIFRLKTGNSEREAGVGLEDLLRYALVQKGFVGRHAGLIEHIIAVGDEPDVAGRPVWWFYEFPHYMADELEATIEELDSQYNLKERLGLEVVYGPTFSTSNAPVVYAFVEDSTTRCKSGDGPARWRHKRSHYTGDDMSHYREAWEEGGSIRRRIDVGQALLLEAHAIRVASSPGAGVMRDMDDGDLEGDYATWVTFTLLGEPLPVTDEDDLVVGYVENENGYITGPVGNPYKASLLEPVFECTPGEFRATARSLSIQMSNGKAVARFRPQCEGTAKVLVNTGNVHTEFLEDRRNANRTALQGQIVHVDVG